MSDAVIDEKEFHFDGVTGTLVGVPACGDSEYGTAQFPTPPSVWVLPNGDRW